MKKVLSQEEIDAVFQGATATEAARQAQAQAETTAFDFHRLDRLPKSQLESLHQIHENFVRSLASKSGHTTIGQFDIRTIYRSCSIKIVRSPSTGTFNAHLNCLRIGTQIRKCPIPLWADLDSRLPALDHLCIFNWTFRTCVVPIQVR